jgi:hypothetical protein
MTPVQFLKKFHPERTWLLTAIATDRKGVDSQAFGPGQLKEAAEWVKEMNAAKKRNIYFSVGEVIAAENKKAERENIKAVHWLHVDIDAGPGDLLVELDRIKALVMTEQVGVPKPTAVIYSGGGFQCFWRLSESISINGEEAAYTAAARYNKQIELIYGGDNCHNVDRIMRLPGTVNYPSAQKVAKGRVPIEASVLYFDKTSYPLSEFTPAADTTPASHGAFTVNISGNIPRLAGVDDLDEWKIADRVKVIIVQGRHPDELKDDDSRSSWLFDVCCQMVRAKCPDEIIYSVITDPNFGISESVLEAKDVDRYAKRQIERAKMEATSTNLRILNERHAVITNYGGKCLVVEDLYDPVMKRHNLTSQSFTDFRNRYMNQFEAVLKANGEPGLEPIGSWWLRHPQRRQYNRVTFAPGMDTPDCYNLWQGWQYDAIPGIQHQGLLGHVLEVICDGNQEHADYLVSWMATLVQTPASPGGTCVVMRGLPGTGKSFLATHFGKLFGRHFLHISNASHLIGNFNNHLRDALLVFGDEAFYAGDKRHVSTLKTLITEELQMVEAKGRDAEVAPNFAHLMLASNSDWVVPVEAQDRRFFVVDVNDKRMRNNAHFAAIADDLSSGGYENLLYYLMTYDLGCFNLFDVPQTKALDAQKKHSLLPHEEWWLHVLTEASFGPDRPWGMNSTQMANPDLHVSYNEFVMSSTTPMQRLSPVQLAYFIRKQLGPMRSVTTSRDGARIRLNVLPDILTARNMWNNGHRSTMTWDNPDIEESAEDLPF